MRHGSLARHEMVAAYAMLAPWVLGLIIFVVGPILVSLFFSFTEWTLVNPPAWAGLSNYREMLLADELIAKSLANTIVYTFVGVPMQLATALSMALLLNRDLAGIRLYRTIFYVPAVTPGVANALLWVLIFNPGYGVANQLLELLGLPPSLWLADEQTSKLAFIIMSLWGVGGTMVIYLAGLRGIPRHLHEAASIDGAGNLQRFRHVTVPLLTPTIFFTTIMGIIGSFQVFTGAYIMTGGGPNNSTLFYMLYLYRNAFQFLRMGYASAMAWLLFVIIAVLTYIQFATSRRWVFYEGDLR
jgi:multiple sugar transport system permease protein